MESMLIIVKIMIVREIISFRYFYERNYIIVISVEVSYNLK